MPVVLVPALVAAGASTAVATAVSNVIMLGVTIGIGLLLQSKNKKKQDSQLTVKQATTPRVLAYGRVKIGGTMFYMGATRTLLQGIAFCEGEIDAYEEVWLNDKITPFVSGGFFTTGGWKWGSNVLITLQTGAADQPVNPAFPSSGHYWWTSAHRNRGLANAVLRCDLPPDATKNFSKVYENGVPELRVVMRARKVYDPRSETTAWHSNSALVIRDYLTSNRGFGISETLIDDDSFSDFADVCDEAVAKPSGGTEPRYRFWGTINLDEEPKDVIRRMLATCDAELYSTPQGKISIRGGKWTAPTSTITDAMIISGEVRRGAGRLAEFNQYRIRYTDATYWGDYQVIEGKALDDPGAQELSGQVVPKDFDGANCASYRQARRLARISMRKNNPRWIVNLKCSIAAIDCLGQRIVTLDSDDLGINAAFIITKFEIDGDLSGINIGMSSLDESAYADDEDIWEHPDDTEPDQSFTIEDVSGLTLTIVQTTISKTQTIQYVVATVSAPADISLSLQAQISPDAGTTWFDMSEYNEWAMISSAASTNVTYQVRARFTAGQVDGDWSGIASIYIEDVSLGPVASALAVGLPLDYGAVDDPELTEDDFGMIASVASAVIDLGAIA